MLDRPWISGVATTLVMIFLTTNLAVPDTGQGTSPFELVGFLVLVLLATGLVWRLPALSQRSPSELIVVRLALAAAPFVVACLATRLGAPQWPPGLAFVLFLILLIFSIRSGRKSLNSST